MAYQGQNWGYNYGQRPVDMQYLTRVFYAVDRDRSGSINPLELQQALSNGTWRPFNMESVKLMIHMFDNDRSGAISFNEFVQLWQYLTEWLNCFRTYDRNNSGSIDRNELYNALRTFGFNLSNTFQDVLIRKFDRDCKGMINFDDYIQCLVTLQMLTVAFRMRDTNRNGWITLSYEDFLRLVLNFK